MSKYDHRNEDNKFKFEEIEKDQSTKKQKIEIYQESIEVKYEHIYQHFMNEMYNNIENGECFILRRMEKYLIAEMLAKFNREQTAKILGVCVRTLRNKINQYGLRDIRQNNGILH